MKHDIIHVCASLFAVEKLFLHLFVFLQRPFFLFSCVTRSCHFSVPLDPFIVAFDKTTYEVTEGTPTPTPTPTPTHVAVCVNLTQPEHDIQDERVFVEVYDDSSSIYIPSNATSASKILISTNGAG